MQLDFIQWFVILDMQGFRYSTVALSEFWEKNDGYFGDKSFAVYKNESDGSECSHIVYKDYEFKWFLNLYSPNFADFITKLGLIELLDVLFNKRGIFNPKCRDVKEIYFDVNNNYDFTYDGWKKVVNKRKWIWVKNALKDEQILAKLLPEQF